MDNRERHSDVEEAHKDAAPRPKIEGRLALAKKAVGLAREGRSRVVSNAGSRSMQIDCPIGRGGAGRFRGVDILETPPDEKGPP